MMPDADIVAFSGSVSNHWSSMSAALMVMRATRLRWFSRESLRKRWPSSRSRPNPGRSKPRGSGGTMDRIGFTNRAMSTMAFAYSS